MLHNIEKKKDGRNWKSKSEPALALTNIDMRQKEKNEDEKCDEKKWQSKKTAMAMKTKTFLVA